MASYDITTVGVDFYDLSYADLNSLTHGDFVTGDWVAFTDNVQGGFSIQDHASGIEVKAVRNVVTIPAIPGTVYLLPSPDAPPAGRRFQPSSLDRGMAGGLGRASR